MFQRTADTCRCLAEAINLKKCQKSPWYNRWQVARDEIASFQKLALLPQKQKHTTWERIIAEAFASPMFHSMSQKLALSPRKMLREQWMNKFCSYYCSFKELQRNIQAIWVGCVGGRKWKECSVVWATISGCCHVDMCWNMLEPKCQALFLASPSPGTWWRRTLKRRSWNHPTMRCGVLLCQYLLQPFGNILGM